MVFNATFNNISAIYLVVSFIGGGNRSTRRKPPTYYKSLTDSLSCTRFEFTTLVVLGSDCTDSCKSNYHAKIDCCLYTCRYCAVNKILKQSFDYKMLVLNLVFSLLYMWVDFRGGKLCNLH